MRVISLKLSGSRREGDRSKCHSNAIKSVARETFILPQPNAPARPLRFWNAIYPGYTRDHEFTRPDLQTVPTQYPGDYKNWGIMQRRLYERGQAYAVHVDG